jgi:CRISPR-associated protein Cas8c/Csd1 subtype I-C
MTILTRLVEFGDSIDDLPASGYAESVVYYLIELNPDGSFKVLALTTDQNDKKGKPKKPKPGIKKYCPHIRRNALQPKLITDTAKYVLGEGKEFEAYLTLLEECYAKTQEPAVLAVLTFARSRPALEIEIDPSQAVTFSITNENGLVHDIPLVKRFWAQYVAEITGSDRPSMQCLVTGDIAPATTKFALQIKGVPGSNAQGGSLISAYLDSCSSYGLEGALVSPISAIADEQLSQTLNYLLREDKYHLTIANVAYVFWSDSGETSAAFFENPSAESVQQYLETYATPNKTINPEWQFRILALMGNSGRLMVRDWLELAEPEFARKYQLWRDSQSENLDCFGEEYGKEGKKYGYLGVWQLARAGVRDGKEILPRTIVALIRNAIYGESLPIDLVQRVCHRNRIERSVTYARAVLLNMFVNQQKRSKSVTEEEQIAFHYGRLLAAYARLQQSAQRTDLANTNAMKSYASAGCSPLPMSHRLASGVKNHLAELDSGLQVWYINRLANINAEIATLTEKTTIPTVFSTNAQAHFDLGFWSELNKKSTKKDSDQE